MRNPARWAAALTLTATAVCGTLTGAAHAAPSSLYAPSALVLTVGHGDSAATASAARAVTLSCAPTATGTHPDPASACAELRRAGGDLDALGTGTEPLCTKQYDPVVVTVDGVWQGRRVSYEKTFANECVKTAYGPTVFAF
ncbi:protease inhibitor protein [Streptomyces sp. Ru71]|uniref:subtilase-type protease inhibitor n=1 Tax=Streptomyces sp. Ru71 TaxID=2080746 RepID=UPI000CDDBCAE|nr:subtilase-type protease inhibitor [Streptomyces sp. Ru71]POX54453.1 protease inhibitor protein [Streptomyces sp. Ru71]